MLYLDAQLVQLFRRGNCLVKLFRPGSLGLEVLYLILVQDSGDFTLHHRDKRIKKDIILI